ncbi:MAG: DNA-protecting protein DprA [Rhodospirillaceae bacterium]|nr:DNA-protecting protein DprA [Rhodospirillaceae bacterium]
MTDSKILSDQEKRNRIRLARTQNVGPVTFRQLITRYGSAEKALSALPELATKGGRARKLNLCTQEAADREWEAVATLGGRLLFWGEADYPSPLAVLDDAPPFFCTLGRLNLLEAPMIAIVGARNASANGRRFARELAQTLGEADLTVVSGLARGIDAAAHTGALETGTVAVLAGGADVIYPKQNSDLYDQILERGLIVSEMAPGTTPQARHFPRRNRIISGLALGVIVAEAAMRSGSLITARRALEQGREVFAVPGSPLDPRCRGSNDLIRNGAVLTESADDVARELEAIRTRRIKNRDNFHVAEPSPDMDENELEGVRKIVGEALGASPVEIDDLIRETGLPAGLVHAALLEFDLAGRLERHSGQKLSLILR